MVKNSKGIPDHSIASTYNTVVKAYTELENFDTAIEYALKYLELIKKH